MSDGPVTMQERLRTDYAWTPRQREVLGLLAAGKTNAEIATALGVTLPGAKWHVAEILSKLDAGSREEAADYWRRYHGLAPRFARVFRGALALGTPLKVTIVATTTAALVAGVFALLLTLGDSDTPAGTNSPSASPSAVVTPTPTPAVPCPIAEQDVCDFALQLERELQGGNVTRLGPGVVVQDSWGLPKMSLVSIGCPMAAVKLGCGASFALGFSSVTPGIDPGEGTTDIMALSFIRDAACDYRPMYESGVMPACATPSAATGMQAAAAEWITDRGWRRSVLNGGIVQGGDLAGRPMGITDSSVRSSWEPFLSHAPAPPSTDIVAGKTVHELVLDPRGRPIPSSGVMLLQSGCWGCDGPTSSLVRVYYGPNSQLRAEKLTSPATGDNVYYTGILLRPGSNEIYAAMCVTGYCGALNAVTTDSRTKVFRSRDGGVSWEEIADYPGAGYLEGLTPDGFIVRRGFGPGNPQEWEYRDYLWPSGAKIDVPADGDPNFLTLFGNVVTYRAKDGKSFLKPDGSVFWTFPLNEPVDENGVTVQGDPTGTTLLVSWGTTPGGTGPPSRRAYVGWFQNGTLQDVFRGDGAFGAPGAWLAPNARATNTSLTDNQLGISGSQIADLQRSVPVLADYATRTMAAIEPAFVSANYGHDRAYVTGLLPGPVAKVTGAGDCLNIREAASTSARILACYRDGVLLQRGGEPVTADGVEWLPVLTIDGRSGFASTQYLER